MNRSFILRLGWIGLGLLVFFWLALEIRLLEIGTQFAVVLVGGCVLGILAVKFILPRIGDAVGTFIYSSGERAGPESSPKEAARLAQGDLAQGDYGGAIIEYERMLVDNPEDTLAISEIAKLWAERLHDPQRAIAFLETQIESRVWGQEDGAFLLFRLADIHLEALGDFGGALAVLEKVTSQFPNTRHSANAHHRVNEIHQAQFKALRHQHPTNASDA